MAVLMTKGAIPSDAKYLSSKAACEKQTTFIKHWKPKSEVWFLNNASFLLGVGSIPPALFIVSAFRRKLQLRNIGRGATYGCTTGAAIVSALISHQSIVTDNILIWSNGCPLCLQVKAALAQNMSSIIYPLMLGPTAVCAIAANAGLRIPPLKEVRAIGKLWWSTTKPILPTLGLMSIASALAACIITHHELREMDFVLKIIAKVEEKYIERQRLQAQ